MRLRYLHLPRCGPIKDLTIVFGQEELLYGWKPEDPTKRKGAINFIVGVNGTGKSSLLRAIYQTFRALKSREFPPLQVTVAWDWAIERESVTAFFHHPGPTEAEALFAVAPQMPAGAVASTFQSTIESMGTMDAETAMRHLKERKFGAAAMGSALEAFLPYQVVAYTSGAETLWEALEHPVFIGDPEEGQDGALEDRPPGWTLEREWEEERPARLVNVLFGSGPQLSSQSVAQPSVGGPTALSAEVLARAGAELAPLGEISRKLVANQAIRAGRPSDPCFRVRAQDLRLAAHALGLWQAAMELVEEDEGGDRRVLTESGMERLRKDFLEQAELGRSATGARRVLNQVDWFWPTHLSVVYRDVHDRVPRVQREQLLCLCALADEVVAQPLGRFRAVVSLGPRGLTGFERMLEESLTSGIPSQGVNSLARRIEGSKTGAEAVLRLFSEQSELEDTLSDCFTGLKSWQDSGLLDELTLTVKRLRLAPSDAGTVAGARSQDDVLVLYEQLSDGEQMLLSRVALLLLMRGQHGSLLLLDEPETHFNDAWKREIIDLVDDNILKTTSAQVLVSTHTSIALTDVFAKEIALLRRHEGKIASVPVSFPTFGEEPGEIMVRLFGAPETIGGRAAEWLDQLIRQPWPPEQREELERIIGQIGAGYYRSELRAALRNLQNAPPP